MTFFDTLTEVHEMPNLGCDKASTTLTPAANNLENLDMQSLGDTDFVMFWTV